MRAKISSLKPFVAFLIACVLLTVMTLTQRNGMPHGIGWGAFGVLVLGGLWVFQ